MITENKNEKLLSVVVPTYNARAYLRDNCESFCIPEILPYIEVLIINDGSTDDSLRIAEEYQRKFPESFKVYSKENGGHGSGINYGIKYARGKYFKVIDADDWVDRKGFINLVKELGAGDADIVYSGFLWAFDNGSGDITSFALKAEIKKAFEGVEYHRSYVFDEIADKLYIKMHNMTIKTGILQKNNILIDEKMYYVDSEYILYPIPYVKTVSFIEDFVYYYRIGTKGQSVDIKKMQSNELQYDKMLSSLFSFYERLEKEIHCSPEKKSYIARIIARIIAGKAKILLSYPLSHGKKKELIAFEQNLKQKHPDIYDRNINKAIKLLRMTNYLSFSPISIMVKLFYGR